MYERALVDTIKSRMEEPRSLMQVVVGPRQTGKSTALTQACSSIAIPVHSVSADLGDAEWLRVEWQQARNLARSTGEAVLIVDEIQKIAAWPNIVKSLWDEDSRASSTLKVFLSGSSSLLIGDGLSDSLMGRFELIRFAQWDYAECREAFGCTLDEFVFFGGYPRAVQMRIDEGRWRRYMLDSIVEPTIAQDVLQMAPIRKPALMRSLFALGARYSAQKLSYTKMLGQLQNAGNTTTLAEYLELLSAAGILTGLSKYDAKELRSRRSSPRLMVHDASLSSSALGIPFQAIRRDSSRWGHLVESTVGAYLLHRGQREGFSVHWWRDGSDEVDFVLRRGEELVAIEVKSGRVKNQRGMKKFLLSHPNARRIVVGSSEIPLESFLLGDAKLFL